MPPKEPEVAPTELAEAIKSFTPRNPTADDAFLMGLMLLLDEPDRRLIKQQIFELVQARIKRAAST
jgi:hypothetical protein